MSRTRASSRGLLTALAAALAALALGQEAPAAEIVFDPDGPGGANGDRTILGLDWLPGSTVSIGTVPVRPVLDVGRTFISLYQAKLGATTGNSTSIPGLNTTFEITIVARLNEVINDINLVSVDFDGPGPAPPTPIVGTSLFTSAADQSTSFVEIYYDDLTDNVGVRSNDLTGVGFTDGRLILQGRILPGNFGDSNFTTQFLNIVPLDQAGSNNRGSQMTVTGSGGSIVSTSVLSYDTSFFKTPGIEIIRTEFNTSLITPFRQADPALVFFAGDAQGRSFTPVLGPINGVDDPSINPQDFLFQSDANQSFLTIATVVPEPSTMALAITGVVVVSLGTFSKRRRKPAPPAS